MDQMEVERINKFVRLLDIRAARSFIKGRIGMHLIFPVLLIYPALQQTNQLLGDSFWRYILMMYCLIIPWDVYMYLKIEERQIMMHLHSAISAFVISITWFGVYYCQIYQIMKESSPLYLVYGVSVYILLLATLFYYRYQVYKEETNNRSGAPKYGIIVSVTILGGIILKAFMSHLGGHINQLVLGFGALLVSYGFATGIISIISYVVARKYEELIELKKIQEPNNGKQINRSP